MRIQRSIVHVTAIAAAIAMLLPAYAGAEAGSPLLSGYGGPGSGSQAILGSGLVNVAGGGGGTGGGTGASSAQGSGSTAQTPARGASRSGGGTSRSATGSSGSRARQTGSGTVGSASSPTVVVVTGATSQNFVLPGADMVDIVLGLLVLALTAALTVVLARRSADDAR